jgi:hypothetical protein
MTEKIKEKKKKKTEDEGRRRGMGNFKETC